MKALQIVGYKYCKQQKPSNDMGSWFVKMRYCRMVNFILYIDKAWVPKIIYSIISIIPKLSKLISFLKRSDFIIGVGCKSRTIYRATDAIYHLPSTKSKRTTGFGFGSKISLANNTCSPPPTSYKLPSDFEKKSLSQCAKPDMSKTCQESHKVPSKTCHNFVNNLTQCSKQELA